MEGKLDPKALRELERDIKHAAVAGLKAGVERGKELLREETRPISRKLEEGVSSELDLEKAPMQGRLIVSGIAPAKPARQAVLHESSGKTKTITLRPVKEYDFAQVVAEGRPSVRPTISRVLLIP